MSDIIGAIVEFVIDGVIDLFTDRSKRKDRKGKSGRHIKESDAPKH